MGWASLLADSAKNPFTSFLAGNANALRGLGVGIASGNDLNTGLANAANYAAQGAEKDDALVSLRQEEAKRLEQLNKTVSWARAQFPNLAAAPDEIVAEMAPKLYFETMKGNGTVEPPANVREWEYFNALPDDATKAEYLRMKRANPYLDLGTGYGQPDPTNPGALGGPIIPKDVQGEAAQRAEGGVLGTNEAEKAIQGPIQEANLQRLDTQTDNVIETIDKATGQAGWGETGLVGAVAGGVPGTNAYDLRQTVQTIKANLGFAELQAMRDASPTGGALGQVAVQELEALQSTLASLDPNQSEEQLKANLATVRDLLDRQKMYRRAAAEVKYGAAAPARGPTAPEGTWVYDAASGKLVRQ